MVCDCCQQHEATIHLSQMVNGQSRELHLCEDCAEESGMNVQNVMSIPEILFGMGAPNSLAKEDAATVNKRCSYCHMRDCDFRKTARLGCPRCYEAFSEELAHMLAGMHKGVRHCGKIPEYLKESLEKASLCDALRKQLEGAILVENFEEAASLRDRIREAENGLG